jgi:predicted transcriptional regulator
MRARLDILLLSLIITATHSPGVFAGPIIIGQPASTIKLEGATGGKVTGEPWNSDDIAKIGKVVSLFYVDPEEKKHNEPLEEAYEKEHLPPDKHQGIAIINMAAAWYPNSMIDSQLKKKQEKFPRTIYVKDMKKALVREWDLQDDSVNLVVFGKDGKVIFAKKGAMSPDEISGLMKLIRSSL